MKTYNTKLTKLMISFGLLSTALTGPSAMAAGNSVKPDNSAINVRDQSVTEVTAQHQSTKPSDFETARLIRAQLTTDETLSTYAKNVKIIVINELITLKGPVNNDAERMKVVRIANNVAPDYKIENLIQVVK